ncbi:TetR/AcrR family transcriptional regulator [Lewinella sp. IMCC34183]|uniref:TetR/AcrR family transcriptional regulator n=1 Tax=Lewinella sp. IMCC34183 TaxID=2248762 RepID=UPI0018E56DFE|nr:TetR/AcrR family transcriptional regulator [Lewinella sp. IMCC34183]
MNTTLIHNNKELILAARDLFMRIGLRSVSMDDIARELGISKKTLYQTVQNKEELIDLVLQLIVDEDRLILQEHQRQASDAIEEMLLNSRHFIHQMRQVSPTTLHDLRKYYPELFRGRVAAHQQEFMASLQRNLERGIREGVYRPEIDPVVVANLYVGMTMLVVDRGIFPARERPLSEILMQHNTYHFNGIANQAGRDRLRAHLDRFELC